MGRKCSTYEIMRNNRRTFGRTILSKETIRRRWEDNIKMDLKETGHDVVTWINMAQDKSYDGILLIW
jgi:hypothetical protein